MACDFIYKEQAEYTLDNSSLQCNFTSENNKVFKNPGSLNLC